MSFLLGRISCCSLDCQEPDCPCHKRVKRAVSQCPRFPGVNLLYCWKLQKVKNFFVSVLPTLCVRNILCPLSPFLLFAKWQRLFAEPTVATTFNQSRGEFLGVRETIRPSEWMPVTLGGSHADYKFFRKGLVDSVNSAASVTAVSSSSQSLLAKLLELVSSLNLVTEDFPCFPFPLEKKS